MYPEFNECSHSKEHWDFLEIIAVPDKQLPEITMGYLEIWECTIDGAKHGDNYGRLQGQ